MAIIHLTDKNFDEVTNTDKTILIDFFANWCGPCKMIAPIIEEIASESDKYKICKVDVDENPALAQKFNISSIPTLIVLKDGTFVTQAVGFRSKSEILELLNS